ncbi:DUF456 domain-containing protein [Halomonas denitrificans]|nr:DUF456 domain-containing protein [Halomonas denitrificans]
MIDALVEWLAQGGVWFGWLVAVVLVLVGVAGAILPALPGTPLVLGGLVLMAWLDDFAHVGAGTLLWLTLLTILSILVDFIATAEGARRFGAGRGAILGATLGVLVGIFFGLPGLLLGPFVGAVLGHLAGRARVDDSLRAGVGASVGVLVGTLAKVVISVVMILWFALAWWF